MWQIPTHCCIGLRCFVLLIACCHTAFLQFYQTNITMLSAVPMIKQKAIQFVLKSGYFNDISYCSKQLCFSVSVKISFVYIGEDFNENIQKSRVCISIIKYSSRQKPSLVKYKLQSSLPLCSASSHHCKPKLSSVLHLFIYFHI